MKIFVVLWCLLQNFWFDLANSEIICDNKTLASTDMAMAKIIMNGAARKYPESRAELPAFCSDVSAALRRIDDYKSKCMRHLAKQVTGVIVYTARKLVTDLCRKNSKRLATLLSAAHCANDLNSQRDNCNDKFIDALLGIYHAQDKYKIPHVCCEHVQIEVCDRAAARRLPACTEDRIEDWIQFAHDLSQNAVNLLCGDYTADSDKCQRLPVRPNRKKSQRRTKSFLLPLIKILESLPDKI